MSVVGTVKPEDAVLLGAWPDLQTDVIGGNNGTTTGTIGRAQSIIATVSEPSIKLEQDGCIEIKSVPLYQDLKDFAVGVYSEPTEKPEPGKQTIIVCKDDGREKYPGGWLIADFTRPDGTLWTRAYYRNAEGVAKWIGSENGVISREVMDADMIWLRKIADEVSLWSGGKKWAALTLDVGQEANQAPIRIGFYRPDMTEGLWIGLLQHFALYGGVIRGSEADSFPDPVSVDILPPPPKPKPCFECELKSGPVIEIPAEVVEYRVRDVPPKARFLNCKEGGEDHRVIKMPLTGGDQTINILISGARYGCMSGGAVIGTQPLNQRRDYDIFGNSKIVMLGHDGPCDDFTIEGLRGHNIWDGMSLGQRGAARCTAIGWWLSRVRDDGFENDNRWRGFNIIDCLLDEIFVGFSSRSKGENVGDEFVTTIDGCLMRLTAMPGAPADPDPGHGPMFKLDANGVKVCVKNTVLAWSQGTSLPVAASGGMREKDPLFDLSPARCDKLHSSENVTICYLRDASYPKEWWVPDGWKVLTGDAAKKRWSDDRAAWIKSHPLVYRVPGVDT